MRARILAAVLLLGATSSAVTLVASPAWAAETYKTRGTVQSFGKDKKYVNIAHDDIPGYMMAMTMSFDPRTPTQLDGLAAGDKVRVMFTVADGKRYIDSIVKE